MTIVSTYKMADERPGIAARLARFARRFAAHMKDRRDYQTLLGLSDQQLRDMGVTREEVNRLNRMGFTRSISASAHL